MLPILKRVIRLDSLPLGQTSFTDEGYLMDRPILTSIGIFEYSNPDGSVRRELRLPEEVFSKESLASYKGKPIIITHDAGLIDKSNVHDESIGTILTEGYRDGDDVRAEIVIHDTDEMKHSRLKELSLGYNLDLDETPGEWNGQPYDAIQRNIRINHLALVREARAGDQARLNIDSRDNNILKGGKKTLKNAKKNARRNDGVLSPEELKEAIKQYKENREKMGKTASDADEPEETTMMNPKAKAPIKPDGETPIVPSKKPVAKPSAKPAANPANPKNEAVAADEDSESVEEKVQMVKDRRDRRDEEGDPADMKEAQTVIANQDEDIDYLFDIIDTLLAEKAFDEAEEAEKEANPNMTQKALEDAEDTDVPDMENEDEDPEATEEDPSTVAGDECEEDPNALAEDEDEVPEEENTDEGEEEEEIAEDEEEEELSKDCGTKMNADSVDAIVRTRIKLGIIGREINLDGLENMSILKAKKAVVKKVRPSIRLDGKSNAFVNAAFELAVSEIKSNKNSISRQKKQIFNKAIHGDSKFTSAMCGAAAARNRMIKRMNKED